MWIAVKSLYIFRKSFFLLVAVVCKSNTSGVANSELWNTWTLEINDFILELQMNFGQRSKIPVSLLGWQAFLEEIRKSELQFHLLEDLVDT